MDSTIASTSQRDQAELVAFHLEAGRRAFAREADRTAEEELRRALYLSPYLAEAHLLLGRVHLRSGRTSDAIQAFKIALWSEETAAGAPEARGLLLSEPLDAERWAARISALLGSKELAALRPRVAAFAREHWSWERCAARYAELLGLQALDVRAFP